MDYEGGNVSDFHGRVLVIEDNTDIAMLLVDFFTDRGHIADYAHDGLTGLHLAASQEHDMIILDLALPGLDGVELCKQLRSVKRSDVPILMLTARDTLDDKLTGFAAGADDYLVKPFELLEVYARVQALWRRSGLGGRSRRFGCLRPSGWHQHYPEPPAAATGARVCLW